MDPTTSPTGGGDTDGTTPAAPIGSAQDRGSGVPAGAAGHEEVLAGAERVLDDVDRALLRLDEGTYGVCEVCGEAIDGETLAASPTARTCRAHLPLSERN